LLAPGLVLVGAGMGLCITPLTSTVLSHADPERAGAVSGALSTMQQVGNALGVAVTGAIFFGSLAGGYAHAFELSVAELGGLLLSVAALSRLLPERSVTR
jgi:MFS family permease